MNCIENIKLLLLISRSLLIKDTELKRNLYDYILIKLEPIKVDSGKYQNNDALMKKIIYYIGNHFGLPEDYYKIKNLKRELVKARQIAMSLIKLNTKLTYRKIGIEFGGKDHTTVLYASRTVNNLRESYIEYNNEYILIAKKLRLKYYDLHI